MGQNTFELLENGKVVATTSIGVYDFAPIVIINKKKDGENALWSLEDCVLSKKERLLLSSAFDEDLRKYIVPEIVIAKNSVSKIPIKIVQGYDPLGFQDNDGLVEFSCTNSKVTIKPESKKVSYGNKIEILIEHTLMRGDKFSIDIKGKDDDDDTFKSSDLIVVSGKLNFTIIEKDVFMEEEIKREIEEKELSNVIMIPALEQKDLFTLIRACDFVVIPSISEGLPMVVGEVMALSKPVIATGINGIVDLLENEKEGLLVPSKDSQALAQAIERLYHDEPLRKFLVKNANEKIKRFDTKIIAKQWKDYYEKMLDE